MRGKQTKECTNPSKEFVVESQHQSQFIMELAILSQNMQGLNDRAKVDMARHYYQRHLGAWTCCTFRSTSLGVRNYSI
jgi:hypothetical protein